MKASFKLGFVVMLLIAVASGCKTHQRAASKSNSSSTKSAHSNSIAKKYANILGVEPSEIKNVALYAFIDDWYGSPYQFGGQSKSGVDCSGFVQTLYKTIYRKSIPRTTSQIRSEMKSISKSKLTEGALVFFDINGKKGSHVGVYLMNGNFVHASTSKGVMISNLSNPYYIKTFSKAGVY